MERIEVGGMVYEFEDRIFLMALLDENADRVYKGTVTTMPNDPLTIEQLREMDGEPVWLHTFLAVQKKTQISCWAILECSSNANAVFLRAGVNCRLTKWFCNYGERWLAYRCKPEEKQNA